MISTIDQVGSQQKLNILLEQELLSQRFSTAQPKFPAHQRKASGSSPIPMCLNFTPALNNQGLIMNRQSSYRIQSNPTTNRNVVDVAQAGQASSNHIQVLSGAESLGKLTSQDASYLNTFVGKNQCRNNKRMTKTSVITNSNSRGLPTQLQMVEDQKIADIQMKQQPTILPRNIGAFPSHTTDKLNLKRSAHFDVSSYKEPKSAQKNPQLGSNPIFKTPIHFKQNNFSPTNIPSFIHDIREKQQFIAQTQSSNSQILNNLQTPQYNRRIIQPKEIESFTQSVNSLAKSNSLDPASEAEPYNKETPVKGKPRKIIYNNIMPEHHKTLAIVSKEAQSQESALDLKRPQARNSMNIILPSDENKEKPLSLLQTEERNNTNASKQRTYQRIQTTASTSAQDKQSSIQKESSSQQEQKARTDNESANPKQQNVNIYQNKTQQPGSANHFTLKPASALNDANQIIQQQLNELHRQVKENTPKPAVAQPPEPKDTVLVKIKVVNSQMQVVQTFLVPRGSILKHMKYFETQLKDGTDEIVEIEVHCNPQIFQFVIDYINELDSLSPSELTTQARLTSANLIPILVSANFLQIQQLEYDCLEYWRLNFIEIMGEQELPTQQLKPCLASKLCDAIPLAKLQLLDHSDASKDRKNIEMSEMIFCNNVRNILQNNDLSSHKHSFSKRRTNAQFNVCIVCSEVYLDRYVDKLECRFKALSTSKQTWPMHKIDQEFDFECFLYYLNAEKDVSWKVIHALLLSNSVLLPRCRTCHKQQTYAELDGCQVHPEAELQKLTKISEQRGKSSKYISTILTCCGQHALWHMPFMMESDYSLPEGCIKRQHDFDRGLLKVGEQKEVLDYLNNVARDEFTFSAVPTQATPPKDCEKKQTRLLKDIKFKDLVETFGDIIFNFEYRRMVTDFFHPLPTLASKSRKQAQSILKEQTSVDEDSEEDSDETLARHLLRDEDSSDMDSDDDYYEDEDDESSSGEEQEESRVPAAYTPEQRLVKRPIQKKQQTNLHWNIKPSTRYTAQQSVSSNGTKTIKHVFKLYSGHMSRQAVGTRMRTIRKNRIGKETTHWIGKFNDFHSVPMLQTVSEIQEVLTIQEQMEKLTSSLMQWRGSEPSTNSIEKYPKKLIMTTSTRKPSNQFTLQHPGHPTRQNRVHPTLPKQVATLPLQHFQTVQAPPALKQPAPMISIEPHYPQAMIASILNRNDNTLSTKKAQQQMPAAPPSINHFATHWIGKQTPAQSRQIKGLSLGGSVKNEGGMFVEGDVKRGGTSKHLETNFEAVFSKNTTSPYDKKQQQFKARTAAYIQRLPHITSKSKESQQPQDRT